MSGYYVDSAAMAKLLVEEAESPAMLEFFDGHPGELITSELGEVELRRVTIRHDKSPADATEILDRVHLFEISRSIYQVAAVLPDKYLRSLDAIHLAAALDQEADAIVTYDDRLLAASHNAGIHTISPGKD